MYKIDPITKNIDLTRGDVADIEITAQNQDGTNYIFQAGDIVRFKVFKKKDCNCVELQKDVEVSGETESVEINLTKQDTTIGTVISKPVEYWYEVELNPDTAPQTIIGYEKETGPKIFTLLPEGAAK